MINEITTKDGPNVFAGYLVLDSGCQRTCCGRSWYDAHVAKLSSYKLVPYEVSTKDVFQFGKGNPSTATTRAYIPSGLGGVPCLLGASILQENIPFLGSNSLLTLLGATINFQDNWVDFETLGVRAPIHRIAGHMAVSLLDFDMSKKDVHTLSVWSELADDSFWQQPHPEFLTSSSPNLSQDHADGTTQMACVVEANGLHPHEPHGRRHQADGESGKCWSSPAGSSDFAATDCQDPQGLPELLTREGEEVRQRSRPLQQVPRMQHHLQVGSERRKVGTPSWAQRALIAIATIASTILGNNRADQGEAQGSTFDDFFFESSSDHTPSWPGLRGTTDRYGTSSTGDSGRGGHHSYLDGLPDAQPYSGPPHGTAGPRGLSDMRDGMSSERLGYKLGAARIPQRADLRGSSQQPVAHVKPQETGETLRVGMPSHGSGRAAHRLVTGGGQPHVKKGAVKQLRGQWNKSAQLLENEYDIYKIGTSVSSRTPQTVDLWELFAGRALCTVLAPQYNLNALQPWDVIYGQDLKDQQTREESMKVLKKFKPYLTLMGLDCVYYNLFNKNLNFSHRPKEWECLQRKQKPLLDAACDIAEEQHRTGRFSC